MFEKSRVFPNRSKINGLIAFIKLLRVEPFLLLFEFQLHLKKTPVDQLIVDKICRLWYNQTIDYCYELPERHESNGGVGHYKSSILADSVQFGAYNTYVSTIPSLIWALFMGAWIDRYVKARKILILMSATAVIIESIINIYLSINFNSSVYYMLLPNIPTMVMGSNICYKIAIISYISTTTPPKWRSLRYLIYELCISIASPIGSAVGGYLLEKRPYIDFGGGTVRNYTTCFFIALSSQVLATLWAIFFVNEKFDENSNEDHNNNNNNNNNTLELKDLKSLKTNAENIENENIEAKQRQHPIKLLFDLKNITDMVRCCVKRRKNKVRAQIWCLSVATIILLIVQSGKSNVFLQFVEKQYNWTPDYYSYMNAMNSCIHAVVNSTLVPFLMRVWKVNDIPLAFIGFYTYCANVMIRGTIITPVGYYLSLPFQSFSMLCNTGIRAYVSKIIVKDEVGKIFGLLTVMESLVPSIANTLYAVVFKRTIDSYPGAMFHMSAAFTTIPIVLLIWIDVYNRRKLFRNSVINDNNDFTDEKKNNTNTKNTIVIISNTKL